MREQITDTEPAARFFILWLTGGILYFYMEIAFRGYSHYSMLICGGFCFALVSLFGKWSLEQRASKARAILEIMVVGSLIITSLEFITGIIVNLIFDLRVWSYARMKYNVMGQICLLYSCLWAILSLPCVYLGGILRKFIFEGASKEK